MERTETILFFFYGHSWDSAGKYFRDFFITYRAINLLKLSTSRHSVVFINFQLCFALGANTVNHLNPPVLNIHFFWLLVLWAFLHSLLACIYSIVSVSPRSHPYIFRMDCIKQHFYSLKRLHYTSRLFFIRMADFCVYFIILQKQRLLNCSLCFCKIQFIPRTDKNAS